MISAETHKRQKSNGKFHCSRSVGEREVFKCKFCGSPITWFKSTKGKVYPVNCHIFKDSWVADVFMGNHLNSSPCHICQKEAKL